MNWASLRSPVAFLLLLSLTAAPSGYGQELACRVQIDKSQLSGSDFDFLDDLERRISEYLNTRQWTDDAFLPHERIACSMQIVFQESANLSTFDTRLILSTRRPIHGTSQSTRVLRINDSDWRFEFNRGTSLVFDLDRYDSLTSTLDFYAYLMLGYDYDTFSEFGGTPHFEQARAIADRARGNGDPGWSSRRGEQTRGRLIEELLQQQHRPLRKALYQYHLKGLDQFVDAPTQGREAMLSALEEIRTMRANVSRSYALDLFFSTKSNEITAAFEEGELASEAYSVLTQVDPSRSSTYNALVQ